MQHIETAHNIHIRQHIATIDKRILAFLLDAFLMGIYGIMASIAYYRIFEGLTSTWIFYLFLLPVAMYHLLCELLMKGQSPGKQVMGIKVVGMDGSNASISQLLIRWLVRLVDISLSSGGVAVLLILFGGKGQRLGDIAAGTRVIHLESQPILNQAIELHEDYQPKYPQVTVLSDQQINSIKTLKQTAMESGDFQLVAKLAAKTAAIMEVDYDEKSLGFLERVIADHQYFTKKGF